MPETFAPVVLLVDDDPAMLDILSRRFYTETSLGVLAIDSLREAREFVLESDVSVDAILSDLSFVPQMQDDAYSLHDGVDLVDLVSKAQPSTPKYICSVYSSEPVYQRRIDDLGLKVRASFSKLAMDIGDDKEKPWNRIERDLYRDALRSNSDLAQAARSAQLSFGQDEDRLFDWIRTGIRPVRQTYLQKLPAPYRPKAPIRVICEEGVEEALITAEAPNLGLVLPGQGETVEDALEELGQIIVDQYRDFSDTEPHRIVGYAAKVFERLKEYVGEGDERAATNET